MKIENKYNEVIKELSVILECPWDNPQFYAAWLAQSYFYSSYTCQVLLMGAAHCTEKQKGLQRRLAAHSGEEKGHEILARRDLDDLKNTPEGIGEYSLTKTLYATQFYQIQNKSVESIMGWVLPLEGIAIKFGSTIRERVAKAKMPTRFLDIHVDEDPDHVESAFKAIQALSPDSKDDVIKNMDITKDIYISILDECKRQALKATSGLKKAS